MSRTSKAHLITGILILSGVLLSHNKTMLSIVCAVMVLFLAISREFSVLRRCLAAIIPIAVMLFAVNFLLEHIRSATQLSSPMVTVLKLSALVLIFSYIVIFYQGDKAAERLAELGLKDEWLIAALSTTSTLPLIQATAVQIIDARFAAGLIRSRSFLSTMFQLPHILRPLFTQTLRLAVTRSDNWHQRRLMERFQLNFKVEKSKLKFLAIDYVLILLSTVWMLMIIVEEYL